MKWINEEPSLGSAQNVAALSVQDVDTVIHQYWVRDAKTRIRLPLNHIMLLETKAYGKLPDDSQRNTLNVLHCALSLGNGANAISKVDNFPFKICYHGLHLLQLSRETPPDSDILWDHKLITVEQLRQVLRFEIDAHTLQQREDRGTELPW